MAQAEVIREFLVQLGFKTDEKSLKTFTNNIQSATKGVIGLVAAIEGAALTVGAGVASFAANLEGLYFAAKKTHSSAENLKAFESTMQDFGVSSGEALQSVQALAGFMRNNPGGESFIKSLGAETRKANGELRSEVEIMADLGKSFSKQPYYLANQRAKMMGISEDTLRGMMNGDFADKLNSKNKLWANSGMQDAANDAHKFENSLREVVSQLEIIGVKASKKILGAFGMDVEKFGEWVKAHGDEIAAKISEVVEILLTLAKMVFPALEWLAKQLIQLDKDTHGWSTKIIALVAVINLLGGFALINGIMGLVGAFAALAGAIGSVETAAGGGMLGTLLKSAPWLAGIAALFHSEDLNSGEDEQIKKIKAQQDKYLPKGAANASGGDPMSYFMSQGWTKEQAAGLVANIKNESSFNPNAENQGHYGLAQWDLNRQANFLRWAGHDIHGSSAAEQLEFMNYELTKGSEQKAGALLRAANNSVTASNVIFSQYERAGDFSGSRRAADAFQIAQTTTINVNGGDAAATGKAVAKEQTRVNQDLIRNLKPAVS